jgi:hypothetical protein
VCRHDEAPLVLLLVPDLDQAPLEVDLTGLDPNDLRDAQAYRQAQADEGVTTLCFGYICGD